MCIYVNVHVHMYVCGGAHHVGGRAYTSCGQPKDKLAWVLLLRHCSPCFPRHGLPLAWSSQSRLRWLAYQL